MPAAVGPPGSIYDSMTVEGSRVRLRLKHVGGGLAAKGGGKLAGFAIAGPDKKFVWADARIDGDSLLVSSDEVPQPAAVRYAWADNPDACNLYNKEGLPASPFRTDDWPVLSSPRAEVSGHSSCGKCYRAMRVKSVMTLVWRDCSRKMKCGRWWPKRSLRRLRR
jgi:hypothetical protein